MTYVAVVAIVPAACVAATEFHDFAGCCWLLAVAAYDIVAGCCVFLTLPFTDIPCFGSLAMLAGATEKEKKSSGAGKFLQKPESLAGLSLAWI